MKRILLIDCDSLIYLSAVKAQEAINWYGDMWTMHADMGVAKADLHDRVDELKEKLRADDIVMALSDYNDPWRKRVMPTYKENRKKTPKPIVFEPLREYVHQAFKTFQRPGLEGDDILGILMTMEINAFAGVVGLKGLKKIERICVSIDKDMNTIPGEHFSFHPGKLDAAVDWDLQIRTVTEEQADLYHLTQTLTGDTVDGYKGCPGIGHKTVTKILNDDVPPEERWERIVGAYVKAKLNEDEALRNARVARICRASDYDFVKKEVVLWNP